MRAPTPSEPKSTFPTYQVPQVSAMRGSAPPVQVARATWGDRADTPSPPNKNVQLINNNNNNKVNDVEEDDDDESVAVDKQLEITSTINAATTITTTAAATTSTATSSTNKKIVVDDENVSSSVINGSSCRMISSSSLSLIEYDRNINDNSNLSRMQSVTENCLLNSVTVPKIQRNDHYSKVTHNNYNKNNKINNNNDSDKLVYKFGALSLGRDIPNQKSDDLEVLDDNDDDLNKKCFMMMMMIKNEEKKKINNFNYDDKMNLTIDHIKMNNLNCDNNDNDSYYFKNQFKHDQEEAQSLRTNPLRLRGGGESAINTGTSGWGTPPSQQASNNNASNTSGWGTANPANQNNAGTQQWNNNATRSNQLPQSDTNKTNLNTNGQQRPPSPPMQTVGGGGGGGSTWGGSASSGSGSISGGSTGSKPTSSQGNQPTTPGGAAAIAPGKSQIAGQNPPVNATSTKQQLEQLNNMREAIFSQDGWGGQHVNQDTNWDIPGSPEPPLKMDGSGPPQWKPAVNNGTDLWEANLRNGGQPPPQPQQKTPWGHTPSTNIGGTWGEDDDTDSSNVWTGAPQSQQQQWGGGGGGGGGGSINSGANNPNSGAMWGAGPKKEPEWGGNPTGNAVGNNGPIGGGGNGGGGGAGGNPGWGDLRSNDLRGGNGGGGGGGGGVVDPRDLRPDLRDMRGNLGGGSGGGGVGGNGGGEMRLLDPMRDPMRMGGGQGGGNGDMRGDPRGITGRLNGAGTADAFWGQSGPHGNMGGSAAVVAAQHMHHGGNKMGPGGGNGGGWEEPSPPTQRRNMPSYDDGTSLWGNPQQGGSHWKDMPTGASMGRGGGGSGGPPGMVQSRMKPDGSVWCQGGGGGGDDEFDWAHKPGTKPPLTKEMIWSSKQFRSLVELGYKKDEVENSLRRYDMNYEEAMNFLRSTDIWRRCDDHYEHNQYQRYQSCPTGQMPFQLANNPSNLLNNMNNAGQNSSLINNMSPAGVQKLLTGGGNNGGNNQFGVQSVAASNRNLQQQTQQPSTQQLRMLVQQIQMAVQAGYLNHQILNQPLAPQTLLFLNQLLQLIKTLQNLLNQQSLAQQQSNGKSNQNVMHYAVMVTKTKQQISNLQNQIAAQQAVYVKQQSHGSGGAGGGPSDIFKSATPMHDSINALQTNFVDLGIKEVNQPQSRLTQWINKDKEEEFSRAPGSSSKPLPTSPLNPLGLTQPDGPWSSGRTGDGGWPDAVTNDVNDWKDAQWPASTQPSLTDLVPEFEPGKPWKGNQIKIEDDPSITPGSVGRASLSIATIKDNELYNLNPNKSPPTGDPIQSISLSSTTWSFNPSSTTSAFTSPQSKLPSSKSNLGDINVSSPSAAVTSELWGAPKSAIAPRGPPPGLTNKSALGAMNGTGWSTGGGGSSWSSGNSGRSSGANWGGGGGGSPWLLLRNLTAQIDGSTLRTLCMQHGPLQSFHLHLHHGFALAKYSSREEANKAQATLNSCVLGNTSIHAENPSEWDANALLQQVASQQKPAGAWRGSANQPGAGGGGGGGGGDTWSTGWSNNSQSTASLWSNSALDATDQARATPSSITPYLPGDLLGGESM